MTELLKSGLVDNSLFCELATHPDFIYYITPNITEALKLTEAVIEELI
jgi:hypothetical protein